MAAATPSLSPWGPKQTSVLALREEEMGTRGERNATFAPAFSLSLSLFFAANKSTYNSGGSPLCPLGRRKRRRRRQCFRARRFDWQQRAPKGEIKAGHKAVPGGGGGGGAKVDRRTRTDGRTDGGSGSKLLF